MNALKHGMTAEIVLMPDEDPEAFERRVREWVRDFGPRTDEECFYAERAAYLSWQVQRNFRAQSARLTRRAQTALSRKQKRQERKASELATQLFQMPIGSLSGNGETQGDAAAQTSKVRSGLVSGQINAGEGDQPGPIVRELESTEVGCRWLLTRWNALGGALEAGAAWNAPERFQAIRLLKLKPLDLLHAQSITAILQACRVIEPELGDLVSEYWNELVAAEPGWTVEELRRWLPEMGSPADAAAARAELEEIVTTESERLEVLIKDHDEHDEIEARYSSHEHAFDHSPGGERMRRYETKCMRYVDRFLSEVSSRLAERRQTAAEYESAMARREMVLSQMARRERTVPAIDRTPMNSADPRAWEKTGSRAAAEQNEANAAAKPTGGPVTEKAVSSMVTTNVRNEPGAEAAPILRNEAMAERAATAGPERVLRSELKAAAVRGPHGASVGAKVLGNSRRARRARKAIERANGSRELDRGLNLVGSNARKLLMPVGLGG